LAANDAEISEMLSCLPVQFNEADGGGFSFMAACNDKDGNLWTGDQRVMDEMFMLGMAIGRVKSPLPRDMWSALPGGVPYYMVMTEKFPVEILEAPGLLPDDDGGFAP
jgi:hypothetical protein